jgi:GNAT superfamily N-acetyltransferase
MTNVVVRSALPGDLQHCLELDPTFATDYVWQMDSRSQDGQISVSFRSVRLPRSMKVTYPRDASALSASWPTCDAILVAHDRSRVAGFVTLSKRTAQATVWLNDLVVAPNLRRQGVGGALLEAASRWGRDRKLRWLIVEVQTKNYPAICFCQKHGLSFCGFNDRYFANQDIALFFAQALS